MKKVVAFSLYGTKQMYQNGAIENSELVKKYYPEWECRFYISQEISEKTIEKLKENGAKVIYKTREDEIDGMFWRFLPISEPDLEVLIIRDADCRITQREIDAVNEWLRSNKSFHIMRDNPAHIILIPGGLFGIRGDVIKNIENLINSWRLKREKKKLGWANDYGLDQLFLAQEIYPKIKNNVLIHTELIKFFGEEITPFPSKRVNNNYVGEVIGKNSDNKLEINLNSLNIKKYPHPIFYYNDGFIWIFQLLKKIKNFFKR